MSEPGCRICETVVCGISFSISDLWLPSVEGGRVELKVNERVEDTFNWESRIGENIEFTLKSKCHPVAVPSGKIELYNKRNAKIDTFNIG